MELGGWPPVLLCFEQLYDRDVVLNRATCLERTGLMITEDMTRSPVELVTKVYTRAFTFKTLLKHSAQLVLT